MKKNRVLFSMLFFSVLHLNTHALDKKILEHAATLTTGFILADQIIPETYKAKQITVLGKQYPLWPQKDTLTYQSFYIPDLTTRTLVSSLNQKESLLSLIMQGYIRTKAVEAYLQTNQATVQVDAKQREALVFLGEVLTKKLTTLILDAALEKDCLIKRILKILSYTTCNTVRIPLRDIVFENTVNNQLPTYLDEFLHGLIEHSIVELGGLLLSYLIEDPMEKEKRKMNEKLRSMLKQFELLEQTKYMPE